LKKAALDIVRRFGGEVPSDTESLMSLPGIGAYSSGAIASIAFGVRTPASDGNVLRVMARIFANTGDIAKPSVKKEIRSIVKELLPFERVGDFNQALMELGATVCLPSGEPKCTVCPVRGLCEGCRQGIAAELPVKAGKKGRKIDKKTVLIIEYGGNICIRQRSAEGLLAGLWEFPNVEGHLSREEVADKLEEWGIEPKEIRQLKASKHIFSHLEWHMTGYCVSVRRIRENAGFVWASREAIKEGYSIPAALKVYLNFVLFSPAL
jgi:A/G-specific adenine glycosylase